MINKLTADMLNAVDGSIEERVAASRGISLDEAKGIVKSMSFSEHMALSEANPEPQGGSALPPQSQPGQGVETPSAWNPKGGFDMSQRNQVQQGFEAGFDGQDGVVVKTSGNDVYLDLGNGAQTVVPMDKLSQPQSKLGGGNNTNTGLNNNNKPQSGIAKAADSFVSGFNKGLNDDVDQDELNRMRELAGIEETSSAGGTCAGGIAAGPSIIGDTSNSSKPTNRLKTKNRLKREEKKRKEKSGRE